MRINATTDYAIKSIVYLAKTNRITPASEIGERINISKNFVINTMKDLRKSGIVESTRGVSGGFYLARDAKEISVYDIIIAIEGNIRIDRSGEDDVINNVDDTEDCALRNFYKEVQEEILEIFKNKTVADILDKKE